MKVPIINPMKIITQSALRTFRKCNRNYEQSYVHLYRAAKVADPLYFGTVWHNIREAWWTVGAPTAFRMLADLDITDKFVYQKLRVMLTGYDLRWRDFVDNIETVGVEVPYEIGLRNPRTGRLSQLYKIQGKIDAIVRKEGKLWVVEEKTAAEDLTPESPYWQRLEIDPQCSLYFDAVTQIYNERPAGIFYFVNVKPAYRPLKKSENIKMKKDGSGPYAGQRLADETPEEYGDRLLEKVGENPERFYQLVEVARLEKDIIESQIDVWDTAQAIRRAELTGVWLRNPDSCIHPFGSKCTFFPVCTNRASLEDPFLFRKADTAHEELIEENTV